MSLLTTLIGIKQQEEILALQKKLPKAKKLLHAKNEFETLEVALEKIIQEFELKNSNKELEEDFDVDVSTLNRIPPKKSFKVKAKIRFHGKGKPIKYDLKDYNFDGENE